MGAARRLSAELARAVLAECDESYDESSDLEGNLVRVRVRVRVGVGVGVGVGVVVRVRV